MKKLIYITIVFLISSICYAKHDKSERYYQNKWCSEMGGITEFVLDNQTRCDCLTEKYAVEFDFASKWAESIGQSLHYGAKTGKRAAIALILEKKSDEKFLKILLFTIKFHNLPIEVILIRGEIFEKSGQNKQ